MEPLPTTTAATFCATLVDEWVRAGLTDAVICPGSRSTPMTLALASDERVRVHVHHDERAAAFVALGLGVATGRPAIVCTTSGTAAVELHPAIVEASHAKVPLLACTADRPPELHDVGAPQTIDQAHLFGSAVRWFCEPGVPDDATRDHWRSLAARAVLESTGSPSGPVHLNLAFREPLLGAAGPLPAARGEGGPWHGRPASAPGASEVDVGALADAMRGRRGVIVAGGPIASPESVGMLAAALRWPVLADPRSGCRTPREETVSHFDALLRLPSFREGLRPEMVLRLGALPASKALATWLADIDAWQIGVESDGTLFDPDRTLHSVLAVEPSLLCERLASEIDDGCSPDPWYQRWVTADADAAETIGAVLAGHAEPTEPAIARDVVAALPEGARLVVSSSMPIRDVEWYAAPRERVVVHANRGANGIDGVVSTAVGVALGSGEPTAVLVGDLAFLHDAGVLAAAAGRGIDLAIAVVDNDGGGIFEFLPPAAGIDRARFETLFATPHGVDIGEVARGYGIDVCRARQQREVGPAVADALDRGGVRLVLARTDRRDNVAVHDEIHAAVARALG